MMYVHYNTPNDLVYVECHNPSLGLTTKARACKIAGQEGSLRVMHAPRSVGKCEGTLTLPKELPLWELESR